MFIYTKHSSDRESDRDVGLEDIDEPPTIQCPTHTPETDKLKRERELLLVDNRVNYTNGIEYLYGTAYGTFC